MINFLLNMVNVLHCKQHMSQKTPANQSDKAVLDGDKSRCPELVFFSLLCIEMQHFQEEPSFPNLKS